MFQEVAAQRNEALILVEKWRTDCERCEVERGMIQKVAEDADAEVHRLRSVLRRIREVLDP